MADQYEYRLNSQYPTMRMAVPFTPNVVFIYNPSNAWLYLNTTTYAIPTSTQFDLSIPPESYVIFIPYTPNTEYAGYLVPPSGDPIQWDCWVEFRRGEKEIEWNVTPGFPVIQPLNPLPDPAVSAEWTAEIFENVLPANVPFSLDFTESDNGFEVVGGKGSYVPGTGFVSADVAAWGTTINGNSATHVRGVRIQFQNNPVIFTSLTVHAIYTRATGNTPSTIYNSGKKPVSSGSGASWQSIFPDTTLPAPAAANDFKWGTIVITPQSPIDIEVISSGRTTASYFGTAIITGLDGEATSDILLPGAQVQFDSSASTGDIALYFWDFGDGETSTDPNPLHVYAADGVYTVTLCVYGVYGGESCLSGDLYINAYAPVYEDYF